MPNWNSRKKEPGPLRGAGRDAGKRQYEQAHRNDSHATPQAPNLDRVGSLELNSTKPPMFSGMGYGEYPYIYSPFEYVPKGETNCPICGRRFWQNKYRPVCSRC